MFLPVNFFLMHHHVSPQLSSVQVLESFIRRVKEVNPLLNCVVDQRYEDALKEAAEADALIKSGRYTVEQLAEQKPYLGVPITTKDCISVKGKLLFSPFPSLSLLISRAILSRHAPHGGIVCAS